MSYKAGKKEITRKRILKAINKGFRRNGFAGAGVDGLAKEADVTSGAFYVHFQSKSSAFEESITFGLAELDQAIEHFQKEFGDNWLEHFAAFYLNDKRTCDRSQSCALQSLSQDVSRSNDQTREKYQEGLEKVVETFSNGLVKKEEFSKAELSWSTLAMLVGGVTLARAVKDEKLSREIAKSVQHSISNNTQ